MRAILNKRSAALTSKTPSISQTRIAGASKRLSSTSKDHATASDPSNNNSNISTTRTQSHTAPDAESSQDQPKKFILQQDEELRRKMSGLSGDGGESGIEYEDGKPADMKRSVKNNMFRYI